MSQNFQPGDFLAFQLEAGFALLRLLEVEATGDDKIWHVAAYNDFFADIDSAEMSIADHEQISKGSPHIALTTRAFESTQVARIKNVPLTGDELEALDAWKSDPDRSVSDRSVRLMLGFR